MKTKKITAFLCITILCISLPGCGSTDVKSSTVIQKESNWVVSKSINVPHKNTLGGFYSDSFGITVGYSGEVHYTNDAGITWPKGNNESLCRFGLDIVSEKIAWNCGNGAGVRKTIDGGQNWKAVTDFGGTEPDQCRYLSFLNENVGWIASPKKLGSTKDGGQNWKEVKLPEGLDEIFAMNLLNEAIGYLIDTKATLYTTKDGGLSWTKKPLNITDIDNTIWPSNVSAIRFMDEKNGTLFYNSIEGKLKCLNTIDGGNTWKQQILPDISGNGMYLSSDGKLLSINSDGGGKITLLKHK